MSIERNHQIILSNRRELSVLGVQELISFDEQGVELSTVQGVLLVSGEGINVSVLDLEAGKVTVGGRIDALEYLPEKNAPKRSFFSKIFPK